MVMQCQTLANEVSQHQLITCSKQSVHVCVQSEFITKACSNFVITCAFKRKMQLVLYMLLSQFEIVLAEALRPLDALVLPIWTLATCGSQGGYGSAR